MNRKQMIERLAVLIASVERPHPVRVAIDGIDAAGKTTLADELVPAVERRGRTTIRASVDGFHRPRIQRYQRGPDSPEGYYHDSFDYTALRAALLVPLGPEGDRLYRSAVFDFRSDSPVSRPILTARVDSVLLFDGVFLLRPELNDYWDYRVFVRVDSAEAMRRAELRDQGLFGSAAEVRSRFETRYLAGQRIYLESVQPERMADLVVNNDDPSNPTLVVNAAEAS